MANDKRQSEEKQKKGMSRKKSEGATTAMQN